MEEEWVRLRGNVSMREMDDEEDAFSARDPVRQRACWGLAPAWPASPAVWPPCPGEGGPAAKVAEPPAERRRKSGGWTPEGAGPGKILLERI